MLMYAFLLSRLPIILSDITAIADTTIPRTNAILHPSHCKPMIASAFRISYQQHTRHVASIVREAGQNSATRRCDRHAVYYHRLWLQL
ncbi:hypothetical protein CC77DRAFT_307272 [Alternaria alternata]|uniref:Secreted protein n=1 Tax=Alternaria alternata TaxID=5599 RepID=A0A177E1A6_ALTAL|nr:hypothetical protein CC77DRAFT_307272 [Alternaria alternata]OAG25211.1 hypothetical protein CC77DRAFT_307272 [Alternaria alternata]